MIPVRIKFTKGLYTSIFILGDFVIKFPKNKTIESQEHFKNKLFYLKFRDKNIVPKIYFYCRYFIIEERLKILTTEEAVFYNNTISDMKMHDVKPENYGFNKNGELKCVDYILAKDI